MTGAVDIIIVNFNTRDELAGCLASLHDARPACLRNIVVVDNASTDDSVSMVQARWPVVQVIQLPQNAGFGAANNVALNRSDAPYALLLNSDTVVPPGAIDTLLLRLTTRGATVAGPRLLDGQGRPEVSFGPMLTPLAELMQAMRVGLAARGGSVADTYLKRYLAEERLVDWVSGACLLVHRESARSAGFFDERFFMYEEDVDLCAAIRRRGGSILYSPASHVVHLRGRSIARAHAAGPTHYDRSHLAFYEKHAPGWAPFLRAWLRLRGRAIR